MPADSAGKPSDPLIPPILILTPRQWAVAGALALSLLAGIELFLRSGVVWRIPLPYLLSFENDRYTLVSWEIHQPKPQGVLDVMAFGSSMTAAVTELPNDEAPALLRQLSGRQDLRLLVMAVPRGCFDEATVIVENLVERRRAPAVGVIFTWPGCFVSNDERASLLARLMPLRTRWLSDTLQTLPQSDRVAYSLVQHIDVFRYRYMLNAWVRRRLDSAVFDGQWALWIPYRPYRLAAPSPVPLETLPRVERYKAYPALMDLTGQGARRLDQLLGRMQEADVRPVLVENPWSPPIRTALADIAPEYRARMQGLAEKHGVPYVDPNAEVDLDGMFNDLLHLTHDGGRRYFQVIAPHIVAALR
jgi:hypothetical protein